jgi:arylsulfatase
LNRIITASARILIVLGITAVPAASVAADVLPRPETPFKGKIGLTAKESVPDWPQPARAPKGAPNIVIVLWDDIGFADVSTFGGTAQTPDLDRLAAQGLRYINFNNTSMCSPTRAALLTGRNHHRVGFGVAEGAGGFPGYNSVWKKSTVSVAEILRRNGYSTAVFGKWHNTPHWEISPVGPFDRWPTSLGFEYFYGFIAGMENHWEPSRLYRNTTPIEAASTPQQGYHLTTDLANEAINWVHTHESLVPDKPYFLYFATGAIHSPHHVPQEWIDRYRGRFDRGWDELRGETFARQKQLGVIPIHAELTPRPAEIPAWSSLSAEQKRLYARQMEVYAGFVAHTDHEIGRVLRAAQEGPGGDNTLILHIVGDNGPATGGQDGATDGAVTVSDQLKHVDELGSARVPLNWHAAGWAWLASTPFQWWKTYASHFGGVRNPLIVSWPARIKDRGGVRSQFTHVNDVAATLYEVTGISLPSVVDGVKQQPLDGVTFAHTFDHPQAPSRHHTQYFEMLGNRALYENGWVAAGRHSNEFSKAAPVSDFAQDRWELYHVEEDFSQSRDLAARYPEKLKKLQTLFDREARKNDVYPLGGAASHQNTPSVRGDRRHFVFYPGMPRLTETAFPPLAGKSYRITAHAEIPDTGAEGILLSYGGRESGFVFYLKGGRLVYESNPLNGTRVVLASNIAVPHGQVVLACDYVNESVQAGGNTLERLVGGISSGTGRLLINEQVVGEAKLPGAMIVSRAGPGSLGIGQGFGSPVSDRFSLPFTFTGALIKVEVDVK